MLFNCESENILGKQSAIIYLICSNLLLRSLSPIFALSRQFSLVAAFAAYRRSLPPHCRSSPSIAAYRRPFPPFAAPLPLTVPTAHSRRLLLIATPLPLKAARQLPFWATIRHISSCKLGARGRQQEVFHWCKFSYKLFDQIAENNFSELCSNFVCQSYKTTPIQLTYGLQLSMMISHQLF